MWFLNIWSLVGVVDIEHKKQKQKNVKLHLMEWVNLIFSNQFFGACVFFFCLGQVANQEE